jgi:2-succinyl-5-enolpyruvyl-6-hydroxy-3-cyclohexene-1-carboxylate synthase
MIPEPFARWMRLWSQLAGLGVRQVVVCPGSRSAPLLQALVASEGFAIHSVVDERSAGYQALGMAEASGRPVVVLTTSGTAAANLLPVACEAFFARKRLILMTADRPVEAVGREQNQAIYQTGLYGPHVRWAGEPSPDGLLISDCVDAICHPIAGPVHVNVPLVEPLYADEPWPTLAVTQAGFEIAPWQEAGDPGFAEQLARARRPLVPVGQREPGSFSVPAGVELPVTGELLANLGHSTPPEAWIYDEDLLPDLVITVGGAFVSKFLRERLKASGATHWHWGPKPETPVFDRTMHRIPSDFDWQSYELSPEQREFALTHQAAQRQANSRLESIATEGFECQIWPIIEQSLPEATDIHLGNSLSVRLACLTLSGPTRHRWWSNRGTSGIDGCLSTAVGHALAAPHQNHLAVLGDVTFFYDHNALWQRGALPNLKVLVVQNQGGMIFRALPGPSRWEGHLDLWTTPHHRTAQATAQEFGYPYTAINGQDPVAAVQLAQALRAPGPGIIDLFTDGEVTARDFRRLLQGLAAAPTQTSHPHST